MIKKDSPSRVSLAIRHTLHSIKNDTPLIEPSKKKDLAIKIANTLEEREAVYRLAYQVYLEKGYINQNTSKWLIQPYDEAQETIILMVQDANKKLVGSFTILFDSIRKLPADKIYNDEINNLRSKNKKIVEISRLVINPEFRNSKETLVLLFNYLAICGSYVTPFDNIIIEVNPRHKEYYKSILCFEELGKEKPCPQVQNAPAVLLNLPLDIYHAEVDRVHKAKQQTNQKIRTLYPYFLKPEQESLVASYLEKQIKPMTAEEKIYFGFVESGFSKTVCV